MSVRTITNPANNSSLTSSIIRGELQILENEIAAGGGGSPGGSDTQIQFNDSGSFGGATITWDKNAEQLSFPDFGSINALGYLYVQALLEDLVLIGGDIVKIGNDITNHNVFAGLDTSLLSADKTFTFPDKDGTFAMLSDVSSPSLTATQIAFGDGSNLMTSSSNFTWDDTNKTLRIAAIDISSSITTGGQFTISSGGDGEAINISGANATSTPSSGGNVGISGGINSGAADPGTVNIMGGAGKSGSNRRGGEVNYSGGTADGTGQGGFTNFFGGIGGSNGRGGDLVAGGGNSGGGNNNGGDAIFYGGNKAGSGTNGRIGFAETYSKFQTNIIAYIDSSLIATSAKTFTFPDASGTLALKTAASGSFTTVDLKTVTVVNGIITSIV